MRITYRQRRVLRRTARGLRWSDPHLAAMLVIFARLTAGEAIASREQATSLAVRVWRKRGRLGQATAHVEAELISCARRVYRQVQRTRTEMRWRFSRLARAVRSRSPRVYPPPRRSDPGLPAG